MYSLKKVAIFVRNNNSNNVKKLIIRTLTGGIYVALIIISLLINSPILYIALISVFIVQGIWEFNTITNNKEQRNNFTTFLDIIGGLVLFFSFYLATTLPQIGFNIITPYLAYLIIRNITQLYIKSDNVLTSWSYSMMSQLFVALPLALLNIIYNTINPHILLLIFIFIWLNDTGAYCVGTLFGKHRLFERISPKKSWEGFWGGLALCIIAAYALFTWCNDFFNIPNLYTWIGLGVLVSVTSTLGDLCESLIKRSLGVKDSGNILPGHGGILDRIDSLLLVTPAVIVFLLSLN